MAIRPSITLHVRSLQSQKPAATNLEGWLPMTLGPHSFYLEISPCLVINMTFLSFQSHEFDSTFRLSIFALQITFSK